MMTKSLLFGAAALALAVPAGAQTTRDPYLWPFTQGSIWNTPIGSGAQYHAINLPPVSEQRTDWEYLSLTNSGSPQRDCNTSSGFPISLYINDNDPVFTQAGDDRSTNGVVAIVQPDFSIRQVAGERPDVGGPINGSACGFGWYGDWANTTLTEDGYFGAHFGSGLSVFGGSIRTWELASGNEYIIQHAIKIELDQNLLYKNPSDPAQSYVWPARSVDAYTGGYGVAKNDPALAMGALLALKPDATPESLGIRTAQGRKLFHALQDYGAYIVDTSGIGYGAPNYITTFCEERAARDTFDMDTKGDFLSDESALVQNLYAVSNNSSASIGGGGTPRRPLAPPFGTVGDGTTGPAPSGPAASSSAPIGQTVALKSEGSGYYVTANLNNSSLLQANAATTVQGWEKFDVVDAGGGSVALRAQASGYYVTCNLGNADLLQANGATSIQGWERFHWIDLGGGVAALKSDASGYYVTCNLGNADLLQANAATVVQGWEKFDVTVLNPAPTNLTAN